MATLLAFLAIPGFVYSQTLPPLPPEPGDTSCLSTVTGGCPTVTTRAKCLSHTDGRTQSISVGIVLGIPCVWCGGSSCTTTTNNVCEPYTWLAVKANRNVAAFEVGSCVARPWVDPALTERLPTPETNQVGGFFSGDYGYMVPYANNNVRKAYRFNLANFSKFQSLDISDAGGKGHCGGFAHGDMGYLMPCEGTKLLRFPLATFDSYQALDLATVRPHSGGFHHGFVVGDNAYLSPRGTNPVPRISLTSFAISGSLQLSDNGLTGFVGGFSDGTYGFLVGHDQGNVVRFNLTSFDVDSLETLNTKDAIGNYRPHNGFASGEFGYVVPWISFSGSTGGYGGKVGRFSMQAFDSWEVLDLQQVDSSAVGFLNGVVEGSYAYLTPGETSKVALFSVDTFTPDSVRVLDVIDKSFHGSFIAGGYLYLMPRFSQNVVRVPLLTSTTSSTTMTSSSTTRTTSSSTSLTVSTTSMTMSSTSSTSSSATSSSSTSSSTVSSSTSSSTSSSSTSTGTSTVTTSSSSSSTQTITVTSSSSSSSTSSKSVTTSTSFSSTTTSSSSSGTSSSFSSSSTTWTSSSSTSLTMTSSSSSSSVTSSSSTTSSRTSSLTTSSTTSRTSSLTASTVLTSSTTSPSSSSSVTTSWTSGTSSSTGSTTDPSTSNTEASVDAGTSSEATEIMPSTTWTATSSSTTLQEDAPSSALAKAEVVTQAVDAGIASLLRSNASKITMRTEAGPLTVVDLSAVQSEAGRVSLSPEGGSTVSLPTELLQALPVGAVLAVLSINASAADGSQSEEGAFAGLGKLATETLDISLRDGNGQPIEVELAQPLLFKLPGTHASDSDAQCVYLDTKSPGGPVWSNKGVSRASSADVEAAGEVLGGVWCLTTHLSIFAAIAQAILGCTNLELLSAEAISAVTEHKGWYKAESAIIVFVVWSLMVLVVILGSLREQWALRLGRTHQEGKSVNLCRNLLNLGPQLIKYRYAVFLVYAKDLLHCATTDRSKLKNSSLTSSVQRFLAVQTGISVACVSSHCWNGGGWIESKASLPYTVICRKLEFHAHTAERVIEVEFFRPGMAGVLRRFLVTSLAVHPLLDAMRLGAGSLTVKKRATLQVAGICGVLATNALIFNFSGADRSWEADAECPIEKKSLLFIIVATLVSITVNVVPNTFLMDIAKQVHGRPLWNLAFWIWTGCFLSGAVLLIVVALSNLNPKDQEKWYASLQWSMTIKLLGMPLAQALRHSLMLEHFLLVDRQGKHSESFRVFMGLSHAGETPLSKEDHEAAERMASQAISAKELVSFAALLGDQVMPNFDPEHSTSDEVMHQAVEPLCARPPNLEDYPVTVEVLEARGLQPLPSLLTCSILHLGPASSTAGRERPCLGEMHSRPSAVSSKGGVRRCCWGLEASKSGLLPDHALAFAVAETGGSRLGMAWLPAREVLACGQWSGELVLHSTEEERGELWGGPREAASVHAMAFTGSRGREAGLPPLARVVVAIRVAEGYHAALALHESRRRRGQMPEHASEVQDEAGEVSASLVAQHVGRKQEGRTEAFCDALEWQGTLGHLPPERMVVHSRQGSFTHLLATVVADALGSQEAYKAVRAMIVDRDFHGLNDMLRESGCDGTRYWIEMFAADPSEHCNNTVNWHEAFLSSWPTILRAMRKAACRKAVLDIEAKRHSKPPSPLQQLLVLDKDFHFFREVGCLAELALARSMRVQQRLALHPEHLHGAGLGEQLLLLAAELGRTWSEGDDRAYLTPYLQDRQAVYEAMRALAVASVKEHREDQKATWQELHMADLAATVGAVAAARAADAGDGPTMDMDGDFDA